MLFISCVVQKVLGKSVGGQNAKVMSYKVNGIKYVRRYHSLRRSLNIAKCWKL